MDFVSKFKLPPFHLHLLLKATFKDSVRADWVDKHRRIIVCVRWRHLPISKSMR